MARQIEMLSEDASAPALEAACRDSDPGGACPVRAEQSVAEAFAAILIHHVQALRQWEETAHQGNVATGVHQMRRRLRRMRAALRFFRPAVPAPASALWATRIKEISRQLGMARDIDVFIEEVLEKAGDHVPVPGRRRILHAAYDRRELAYRQVGELLVSSEYISFKRDFLDWLQQQGWWQEPLSPDNCARLESNVLPFLRVCLDKKVHKVLLQGTQVDPSSAMAMHELRIRCTELGYVAECFSPLFPGIDEFVRRMKDLSTVMGLLHDVTVMHELLDELIPRPPDREMMQYAGALMGWRACEYYQAHKVLTARWRRFVNAKHLWWHNATAMG